ncbi:7TM GPCR protein [Aphelenchoides avenae]|nr:7TM GPCR protein [Aphelenchus avenae]
MCRTSPELRKYSRVLLCSCTVEIVYTATCLLIDEHLSFQNGILFMVVNGFYTDSYDTNFALVMFQIYMIYATLAMGTIPLTFRYFSICRQHVLTILQLLPIVVTALLLPSPIVITGYVAWYANGQEIRRRMSDEIRNMTCGDPGEVPLFTAGQILSSQSSVMYSLPLLGGVANVLITSSIIIFCTVNICVAVRQGVFSVRVRALQRQLNSALAVQALNPLVAMVIPLGFALAAMLTESDRVSFALPAVTAITAYVPLLNPLSTIFFIRSYREAVIHFFSSHCVRKRIAPHASTFATSSSPSGRELLANVVWNPHANRFDRSIVA